MSPLCLKQNKTKGFKASGQSASSPGPSTTRPFQICPCIPFWPHLFPFSPANSLPYSQKKYLSICSSPNAAHSSLAAYMHTGPTLYPPLPDLKQLNSSGPLNHHLLYRTVSDPSHGTPSMPLPKKALPYPFDSSIQCLVRSKFSVFTDTFLQ